MNVGIAVDLRCRGLKDFRLGSFGEPQHINCSVHTRLCSLHRIVLIVDGGGWASQIVYLVDLDVVRKCHIVTYKLETLVAYQVFNVSPRTSKEIIDTEYICAGR